ncbi:LysM peptidoglycan-binding domain-containing protein, partial [Acidiphilium sp.]|uniref:LysM peptidoglycan-binding domain-containing protein n=1 Tax=Acidiphilium sp. TaxID=527 RepID=UPI00258ABBC0
KLPAGAQELALQAAIPGAAPVAGDTPALLVVPDRATLPAAAEAKPAAAPPAAGTAAIAVLAPPDAPPRLLSVPADPPGTPAGQVALRVVDYDAHAAIRFAGTARPGSVVRLYIDNAPVGEARADSAGRWSLEPAGPVTAGPHRLRADALGTGGRVVSRAELPFERAAFAADEVAAGRLVVQPRQTLWRIARHVYGHGMRYTVIYEANRDQIRDPARIYPGQVLTVPASPPPVRPIAGPATP